MFLAFNRYILKNNGSQIIRLKPYYILTLLLFTLLGCDRKERLFWVDSGRDYLVLTDVLNPDLEASEAAKVLSQEELASTLKPHIREMQDIAQSVNYKLKAYYLNMESGALESIISLRTTNASGKLIDHLHFSSWPSTKSQPFCESIIYKDLTIKKECANQIERWRVTEEGYFVREEDPK